MEIRLESHRMSLAELRRRSNKKRAVVISNHTGNFREWFEKEFINYVHISEMTTSALVKTHKNISIIVPSEDFGSYHMQYLTEMCRRDAIITLYLDLDRVEAHTFLKPYFPEYFI